MEGAALGQGTPMGMSEAQQGTGRGRGAGTQPLCTVTFGLFFLSQHYVFGLHISRLLRQQRRSKRSGRTQRKLMILVLGLSSPGWASLSDFQSLLSLWAKYLRNAI